MDNWFIDSLNENLKSNEFNSKLAKNFSDIKENCLPKNDESNETTIERDKADLIGVHYMDLNDRESVIDNAIFSLAEKIKYLESDFLKKFDENSFYLEGLKNKIKKLKTKYGLIENKENTE